jgi:uncharacterized protein (TIGR02246 family)
MKRTAAWIAAASLAAAVSVSAQHQQHAGGTDAVKAIANAYVKAVLAGDAKAVAALYADDAVEMPPFEPLVKGRAAIQKYYEKQLAMGKMSRFTLTHLDSHTMGDRGYDVGTYNQSITPQGAAAAMDDTGKYTVILKRVGSDWKIAYAIYNSDHVPKGMK